MHQQRVQEGRYYMNKREAQIYKSYLDSTAVFLTDVYGSCSAKKQEAYRNCVQKHMDDIYKYKVVNPLRIISHCRDFFTVAWTVETDDFMYLHVITPYSDYLFEVAVFA